MAYTNNKDSKKPKIAMIAPVPFYYQTPFYRKLAESSAVDLTVYYCSDETIRGVDVEKLYCAKNKLAGVDMLKGYNYKFLKNYSPQPSFMRWPFGLMNLGVWKEIKNGRYDAVIIQSWTNLTWWLALMACLKFNVPVCLSTDTNIHCEKLKSKQEISLKKILLGNLFFKKINVFLISGKANEEFYKFYGVPENKMIRLPYQLGFEQFIVMAQALKPRREIMRKAFGIAGNDFVLLFVGRLANEKNLFTLLNAYNKVDRENKKLFIIGDGPLRRQIEKSVKDLKIKNIFLKGFQNREALLDFYNIGDVLVLPSEKEPWGMVVNEAMCFSLPIIVSDKVGAGVDLVKDNYNGFVFPSNNIDKLSDCIKKLIDMQKDERIVFGSRSFEIINQWLRKIDPVGQIIKALEII